MALGNNAGSGTARHKGQVRQAIKQRRAADRYLSFTGSELHAAQGGACRLSVGTTYYHSGSNAIPRAGDVIYREKRARSDNRFGPGYIQFQDRGRGFTIEINERGMVVGAILAC